MGKNRTIALGLNQLSAPAATLSQVQTEISNLVNSAPATLNTLKELSDALGSDANFSTTVTNSLALKLDKSGGTLTGNITIEKANPFLLLSNTNNSEFAEIGLSGSEVILNTGGRNFIKLNATSKDIYFGGDSNTIYGNSTFYDRVSFTKSIKEKLVLDSSTTSGSIYFSLAGSPIRYLSSNSTGNFTVNFAGGLNTILESGDSINATLLITNGTTAYYPNIIQIDGTTVTPKWVGGTAPTSGDANAINIYSFNIIKTAANTYTVIAAKSKAA